MGSLMSIPTALSLILIAGGILYGFLQKHPPPPAWAAKSVELAPATTEKKKGKKKKGGQTQAGTSLSQTEQVPTVIPFPTVVPGGFESAEPHAEPENKVKGKKKKAKKAAAGATGPGGVPRTVPVDNQSESSATAPESPTPIPRPSTKRRSPPVIENDGPWTRVESRKRNIAQVAGSTLSIEQTPSDAGITTSVTGNSSPVTERTEDERFPDTGDNRRTLAERLVPKPRKTGVEDMVETPDVPGLARVMRVQPQAEEQPAVGFSWADYEDVEEARATADDADGEDEGGWVVKSGRTRTRSNKSSSQPPRTAPEALTKKQRQNLSKREVQKSAKADAEAERLAILAKHKKELEKARIAEQSTSRKTPGGGMNASMNAKGHLVWD